MLFYETQNLVQLVLWVVFGILKIWAFVDCLRQREDAFPAVGRQSKNLWLILTGITALTALLPGLTLGLIGFAGLVVAMIYLFDIRPRIAELSGGPRW